MGFFAVIEEEVTFATFGTVHLVSLAVLAVIYLAVFLFRKTIAGSRTITQIMRFSILGLMILQQVSFYIWGLTIGQMTVWDVLPLHLCAISIMISIYVLATKDKRMYGVLYYIGVIGATLALLMPSMGGYSFPHFRFFQYFVGHGLIILAIMFFAITDGISVDIKDFAKAFVFLQICGIVAFAVNVFQGTNFMFLLEKPDSASIIDLLADWPIYIIQLEFVALLFMALVSAPFIAKSPKAFFCKHIKKKEK